MKNLIILLFLLISNIHVEAQASYDTQIAFILRDGNNEKINLERFKKEYKFADVFGKTISNEDLKHYFYYDEETNYFILNITTIGPRFSFALYHNDSSMIIYLPFNHKQNYYALDFKFRPERYLFDFSTKNKEKLYLNSNMPYYLIDNINWKKQKKTSEKQICKR
ncbi:hypothetical protein [Winogradskyella sp. UBA3174]|uniref:hypothetical protein n=1 Tax=Winogradskyella sp. UBA3174 TaxID=1947785 RepID=UPI0025DC5815|nr:hypothetical protein [Winogradskyella sp. UBA3174]|tara:strand:+ start:664 stop:1158 length:495 start_codon:yes stop_codon:yes gene_type:complete